MITDATDWRIRVQTERMAELRSDERFRHIVILGRLLNALRQLQLNYLDNLSGDAPSSARQRIGSFFFMASTLHEGLTLLSGIGKTLRGLKSWETEIVPILRSPAFKGLRSSIESVRNQAVFHFDQDCFIEPLAQCDSDKGILAAGRGRQAGSVHFPLSDLMAMALFTGSCEYHESRLRELLTETRDLLLAIVNAGESVVTEYCRTNRFAREVQVDGMWREADVV